MKKIAIMFMIIGLATGCHVVTQGTDKERGYTGAIQTSTGIQAEAPHYE